MSEKNPYWPFATREERDAYDALQAQGYAVLKQAHEAFMAATKKNSKD